MSRRDHRDAARAQRVCAVTGRAGAFHAHHVVREQDVISGDPNDRRNSLRLSLQVHSRHHHKLERVPMTALSDENISYAVELFGCYTADYLRRHYGGEDPRISRLQALADG